MRATHYYVFYTRDQYAGPTVFINDAMTLTKARAVRAWLKDQGCPVGPIVKVPIPAVPKAPKKRGRK